MDRNSKYAVGASVLLLLGALAEVARVIFDVPWRNIAEWTSDAISITLTCLFVATAIALLRRRKSALYARVAWMLAIVAPVAMFVHASVTRVLDNPIGMLYLVGAALTGLAIKRTLDHGELERLRAAPPGSGRPRRERRAFVPGGMHPAAR